MTLSSRTQRLRLICVIISIGAMSLFSGCGVAPMSSVERTSVAQAISQRGEGLVKARLLPNQTPMREVELVRYLLRAHKRSARYLSFFITAGDLTSQSVRRIGGGQVGDLIIFRYLPRAIPLAVISEVLSPTRYRAIGILRGEVRYIEIDLASPDKRRRHGEVINTVLRPIHPDDAPPYLYLAGELFSEFRRIF